MSTFFDEDEDTIADKVQAVQDMLIDRATGGTPDEARYLRLRRAILADPTIAVLLPDLVKRSRSIGEFWGIIQPMFSTYQERRLFLYDAFRAALDAAESESLGIVDKSTSTTLTKLDQTEVSAIWVRAMKRRIDEPEGAITLARTLLETVCNWCWTTSRSLTPTTPIFRSSTLPCRRR